MLSRLDGSSCAIFDDVVGNHSVYLVGGSVRPAVDWKIIAIQLAALLKHEKAIAEKK